MGWPASREIRIRRRRPCSICRSDWPSVQLATCTWPTWPIIGFAYFILHCRRGGMGSPALRLAALAIAVVLFGCTQNSTGTTAHQLAADQTLRIPIDGAPQSGGTSLDPGLLSSFTETAIGQNLFDGLYSYDAHMHQQPDLAQGPPQVSADGMTYTFHIRPDARFWNGDPVTANDFVYSWNRAAALQGDWASNAFQPVAGYDAVAQAGQITSSTHLDVSAPDAHTLVAHLSQPAGYWIAALVLPATWVVDEKAVATSPDQWWTTPESLVGTGPFR